MKKKPQPGFAPHGDVRPSDEDALERAAAQATEPAPETVVAGVPVPGYADTVVPAPEAGDPAPAADGEGDGDAAPDGSTVTDGAGGDAAAQADVIADTGA